MWIPSPVVPLIQFADSVRAISSTQLDSVLDEIPQGLEQRLRSFDEIVSWYGANRPEFREVMAAVHPRCEFLNALPDESWQEHTCDFFLQQVGAPKGLSPCIKVDTNEQRRSVVIHPSSGSARKNWPLEKFRELANRLPLVEWAEAKFESLLDLAHWMKGASSYLGNDSGISHLAAAIGLPSVVLFGPTNPAVWAPRGNGRKVIVLRHQPLSELSVDTVLKALAGLASYTEVE